MIPQFKNDREILLALWHKQDVSDKNQTEFFNETLKFQHEIRNEVKAISDDVLVLKERKRPSIVKLFKWLGALFTTNA